MAKKLFSKILSSSIMFIWLCGCAGSEPAPSAASLQAATQVQPTAAPATAAQLSTLTKIKQTGVLTVGTAITKPFEYHDPNTDELIGFDVDTAQYIADKLGVQLKWVEMPFAVLLPSLQEGKIHMTIAAMYITPARQEQADFAEPYIQTGLVMVLRSGLENQVRNTEDLGGLQVGVKTGATGAKLAYDLEERGITLQIHEYKETLDSLLDLEVGQLDVVLNDYLNTLSYLKDTHSSLQLARLDNGEVNMLSNAGLGIAVQKGNRELLDAINAALKTMQENGTYDRLYEKWLQPTTGEQNAP